VGARWSHDAGNGVVPWDWQATSVLEEDGLSSLTSISEPRLVGDSFVSGYAVPFGKRDESQAGFP